MSKTDKYQQSVPYPVLGDAPNAETALGDIVNGAVALSNMRFANANARAAAIPSPVDGMETYLIAEQRKEIRVAGTWQEVVRGTRGWVDVTLGSLYQIYNGSTVAPRVRQVGPIVYMEGRLQRKDGANIPKADPLTVGIVPSGYRPVGHYAEGSISITNAGAGAPVGRVQIDTDGTVSVVTDKPTTWIGFSSWWFVN